MTKPPFYIIINSLERYKNEAIYEVGQKEGVSWQKTSGDAEQRT